MRIPYTIPETLMPVISNSYMYRLNRKMHGRWRMWRYTNNKEDCSSKSNHKECTREEWPVLTAGHHPSDRKSGYDTTRKVSIELGQGHWQSGHSFLEQGGKSPVTPETLGTDSGLHGVEWHRKKALTRYFIDDGNEPGRVMTERNHSCT